MTHESESEFVTEHVRPYLSAAFPDATVEEQRYIDYSEGFADFWVDLGDGRSYAVEVGNDESVRDEAAQAIEYAGDDPGAIPMVIIPAGHADPLLVHRFRERGVAVVSLPTDNSDSPE